MGIDVDRLTEAAREELTSLWHDLDEARMHAYSGGWSMKCDSLVERIRSLTLLVGPTPWEQIQIPLLEDGVYQRVHAEMGVEVQPPDMQRVSEMRALINGQAEAVRP